MAGLDPAIQIPGSSPGMTIEVVIELGPIML